MGVNGLIRVIETFAPDAVDAGNILGPIAVGPVAIDISIIVHQLCAIGRTRHIVNRAGKFINHIQGVFYKILNMLESGIVPICVFDGPPPALKAAVIAKRRGPKIPTEVFTEVRMLLELMGIRCIQAPGEAEALCARVCDQVATEDTDALVFGAKIMIRGLGTPRCSRIHLDQVLEGLALTHAQFIDLCILLGTDYGAGAGIGPKAAILHMRKYGSIEGIIGADIIPPSFQYVAARAEFTREVAIPVMPTPAAQLDRLGAFLRGHDLPAAKITKGVARMRAHAA